MHCLLQLIYAGRNIHHRNHNNTPLHHTCLNKQIQTIVFLIDDDADINQPGDHSGTPLTIAIQEGNYFPRSAQSIVDCINALQSAEKKGLASLYGCKSVTTDSPIGNRDLSDHAIVRLMRAAENTAIRRPPLLPHLA